MSSHAIQHHPVFLLWCSCSSDLALGLAGGGDGVGLAVLGQRLRILGVDLEEVVQDDHKHGGTSEEDGKSVEGGVGDHGGRLLARPGVLGINAGWRD